MRVAVPSCPRGFGRFGRELRREPDRRLERARGSDALAHAVEGAAVQVAAK